MFTIRNASDADLPAISKLLQGCELPHDDVHARVHFMVAEENGHLVGVGGIEPCGASVALLRAFAVQPAVRGRGIARALYEAVRAQAYATGIRDVYLLTTTAERYFTRLGFTPVARDDAPEAIRRTRQFCALCPDTAQLMHVRLEDAAPNGVDPGASGRALFDAGYYCAEAVLLAVARHAGVDSPLIPAIATGFCSGVSRTSGMCGALTGGILGLNLAYGRDRAGESVEQNYRMVQRLVAEFDAACGSTQCSALLGCDLGTPEGQQAFRDHALHTRCREFSAIATRIAVALCDDALPGKA